jgi:tetratricopeptide (TPR) repeat protein
MIVRDEVDVLANCLRSARDLIDYWVICDTGSTDGTQDLIGRELADVPGELHEHEWVDFGHNRSALMALAHGKAEYLLVLDADTTVEVSDGGFLDLEADAYMLCHFDGGVRYHTKRLVSGRIPWRYVGAAHEYIVSDEEQTTGRLDGVVIRSASVGAIRKGRWPRDAELLERALEDDPGDGRSLFYLAQTYRDIGVNDGDDDAVRKARDLYVQRGGMAGWDEETYCAWHQAGLLSMRIDDWPSALDAFIAAWELRPQRLEAVHDLAVGLAERGQYRAAHQFAQLASGLRPLPIPDDVLFVAPWVYEWGLLFQFSITAYWCGDYAASISACKRLLAMDDLPTEHRDQTALNLRYALRERTREASDRLIEPRRWAHAGQPTRGRSS